MKKEVKSKCECGHLCVDCKHYNKDRDDIDSIISLNMIEYYYLEEYCLIRTKTHKNCVTGEETTEHVLCKDYNKNGQCKKFAPLPHAELKRIIKEYRDKILYKDPFSRETVLSTLLTDLVKVLEGGEGKSGYFTSVYYGDSPYTAEIIIKESAIFHFLSARGLQLEEEREGTLYGGDGQKLGKDDYTRQKTWLDRLKRTLGKK